MSPQYWSSSLSCREDAPYVYILDARQVGAAFDALLADCICARLPSIRGPRGHCVHSQQLFSAHDDLWHPFKVPPSAPVRNRKLALVQTAAPASDIFGDEKRHGRYLIPTFRFVRGAPHRSRCGAPTRWTLVEVGGGKYKPLPDDKMVTAVNDGAPRNSGDICGFCKKTVPVSRRTIIKVWLFDQPGFERSFCFCLECAGRVVCYTTRWLSGLEYERLGCRLSEIIVNCMANSCLRILLAAQ